MAYDWASNVTGDGLASSNAALVHQKWAKGVEIFEQTSDWFKPLRGPSMAFPIQTRTDLSAGDGQKMTFPTMAGLYGRPHIGDELFENGDHYEKYKLGEHDLYVDIFRHGVRFTERGERKLGMVGEIVQHLPAALGTWLGRLKTKQQFHRYLKSGTAGVNYMFINNRTDRNDIRRTDTLTYNAVTAQCAAQQTSSAKPAYVGTDQSGNQIFKHIVVSCSDSLYSLDLDPDYKSAKIDAGSRGPENLFFKGGYANLRGQVIREYTAVNHDGQGPIGSPINPRAELGVAITAANTAQAIQGGGTAEAAALTRVDMFEDFPNFAWRFRPDEVVDVTSPETFYVAIVNTSGADKGKFGFYKCTTNTGIALTMTERLRAADGGAIGHAQVGQVVWDAAKNTDAHPVGSQIILCSAYGAPIGHSLFLGACSSRFGIGQFERRRVTQEYEGGYVRDVFIQSIFGVGLRKDVRGRASGYSVLTHAISYPGITINPTLAT